ncbi:hypothetical protein [Floridanema flaviceps]
MSILTKQNITYIYLKLSNLKIILPIVTKGRRVEKLTEINCKE